jgi:signal transduction histidine kinase
VAVVTRARLLVADDDDGARTALAKLLRAEGFEISTAPDGEAALAEAMRALPDAVLTDLQMPRMNGTQLCRRLHEIDPDLPVVVMTAHSDMQSAIASLRAGAEDCFIKPLEVDTLVASVERAIARRSARREHEALLRALNERLVLSNIREQELREAERQQRMQLGALLEKLAEGVVIVEPGGRVRMINDAAREMLECADECPSVDALRALEMQAPDGHPLDGERDAIGRALRGEQFQDFEALRVRANGERRHIVSTATHVKDAAGNVALAIVVFRDVTEQRRLEQQRDEYLALVTHDLRNPLGAILMSLGVLASMDKEEGDRASHPQRVNLIERVVRNCRRMNAMLEELTEATSLEAHGVSHQSRTCDLRELIVSAVDGLSEPQARRITTETDGASSFVVVVDARRLERVITNLLTNALKYSAVDAPVTVRLARHGNEVTLDVIDRGIGIAPEHAKRLFERYYRTSAGKAHAGGLGLGLYIAHLIVEAEGGRIGVASEVGRGSTFSLTLPSHVLGTSTRPGVSPSL